MSDLFWLTDAQMARLQRNRAIGTACLTRRR